MEVNDEDLKPFTGPLAPLAIQPGPPPVRPPPHKKKFTCVVCQKGVGTEGGLKYHLRTHLLGRPFKCSKCDKSYATKNDLDTHFKRHANTFDCDFCSKKFPAKAYLNWHITSHHMPKDIPCVNCCKRPRFFATKRNLQHHYSVKKISARTPMKVKAICKLCGARFAKLKGHEKHCAQMQLLKYVCLTCGARFTCYLLWRAHIKKEKSERRRVCKKCNEAVGGDLQLHRCVKRETAVHVEIKKEEQGFLCDLCDAPFDSAALLQQHVNETHPAAFWCIVCSERFHTNQGLLKHMPQHHANKRNKRRKDPLFKCLTADCLRVFNDERTLDEHFRRRHHGAKYPCDSIPNRYPLHCDDCCASFGAKKDLIQHMRSRDAHTRRGSLPKVGGQARKINIFKNM